MILPSRIEERLSVLYPTRAIHSANCCKSFALGWVTVPMTHPLPQITVASLTVVLPPLNGFQQGSIGTLPRTFSERSHPTTESRSFWDALHFFAR